MDHREIEEAGWIESYLAGRLTPAEADAFERHYVGCAECLDRLEVEETLRDGLRAWSAEQAVRQAAGRAALLAWLARAARSRRLAAALSLALLLVLVPGGLLLRRVAAERDRLAAELAGERAPRIDTAIVTLSPLRSAGAPTARVALRPDAWIVLALELDGPRYPAYAATLSRAGGARIWHGEGLRPDASQSLTLSLPAALLVPGDYEIRVDGLPPAAPPQPVARFPFRAVRGG